MDTINYAILRTISEERIEGPLPGYAGDIKRTITDEMTLYVGEYVNPNVVATGTVSYVDETWKCSDGAWDVLLHKLPLLDRLIPRSFIIEHDDNGRITANQGPVTLALLDIKNKRGEHYELVAGEIPTDIALTDGFWFNNETLERRPDNPTTVRGENRTVIIENVPEGSQIFAIVEGAEIPVDDHEIEVDEPGEFAIRIISPWPMRETRYDVQVE